MELHNLPGGNSHRMTAKVWMVAAALALFACASIALGQAGRGSISGRVVDSAVAVVPGAKVAVTNVETNVTISLETNETGYYEGALLIPGTYRISAEATGFKKFIQSGVTLLAGARQLVDLKLEVGNLTESVCAYRKPRTA